jgi:tmRNA-binding protein
MTKDSEINKEIIQLQETFAMRDKKAAELTGISIAYYSHKKKYRNGNSFNEKDLVNFKTNLKELIESIEL